MAFRVCFTIAKYFHYLRPSRRVHSCSLSFQNKLFYKSKLVELLSLVWNRYPKGKYYDLILQWIPSGRKSRMLKKNYYIEGTRGATIK